MIENWRVERTTHGRTLAEVKIQRGIFLGDSFMSLLFVLAIMLLNSILRKCIGSYKFYKIARKGKPPHVYGGFQDICKKNKNE